MIKQNRTMAFFQQLHKGKKMLQRKEFAASFYYFENAHILGQKNIYHHTLAHCWMFIWGVKSKNKQEIIGQFFRIVASLIFTLIWVPKGNTGGTNISAIQKIPIRKELQKYF